MRKLRLGIDIGGTNVKYLVADNDYNIVDKWSVPTPDVPGPDQLYDYICRNMTSGSEVDLIGISSPGLIDKKSNVKSYASEKVKIMYNTNIIYEIQKRTGIRSAAINDAKAAGLCELRLGNARYTSSSAFLIIGTGIGGCICSKEDVIYGADGFSGEFHFLSSYDAVSDSIIRQGDFASVTGLINIYRNLLPCCNEIDVSAKDIINLYLRNEKLAEKAVKKWIMNISVILINISVLYNPQVICIGGGLSEEKWLIEMIEVSYNKLCRDMNLGFLTTKIMDCKFKNDANALGAILNAEREIYGKTR